MCANCNQTGLAIWRTGHFSGCLMGLLAIRINGEGPQGPFLIPVQLLIFKVLVFLGRSMSQIN